MRGQLSVATLVAAAIAHGAVGETVVNGEIGRAIDAAVESTGPGPFWGSVLVARNGEILLAKGYGLADLESVPNSTGMLFDVGSLAKQFTAAAILALAEENKLDIDTSISTVLSDVPEDKVGITIRHLLTHTSGLTTRPPFGMASLADRDAMVRVVLSTAPVSPPGLTFEYSNVGYFVLAAILEHASGQPFETVLRERLFVPAGMTTTGFVQDETLDPELQTARVYTAERSIRTVTLDYNWNWGNRGATGVVTTAQDLLRWHEALRDGAVLGEANMQTLFAPGQGGYACGWFVGSAPDGGRRASHGGSTGGYTAWMSRGLDDDVVVIITGNQRANAQAVAAKIDYVLYPEAFGGIGATLYLGRYPRTRTGMIEIERRCRWRVMPQLRGMGADGRPIDDPRPTLVVEDASQGFWPAIVRVDPALIEQLARDLQKTLEDLDGGDTGMDVALDPIGEEEDEHGVVSVTGDLCWRVRAEDGRVVVELQRIEGEGTPLQVIMSPGAARRFRLELEKVAGRPAGTGTR